MARSDHLPVRRTGMGPLDEFFQAIDDEIAASLADPSRAIDVFDGKRLHRSIGGVLYGFRVDSPVPFQPETPITLIRGDEEVRGSLVTVEDFDVLVSISATTSARKLRPLGSRPAPASSSSGYASGLSPSPLGRNFHRVESRERRGSRMRSPRDRTSRRRSRAPRHSRRSPIPPSTQTRPSGGP
jgi:hypothetical protein